MAAKKAPAKKMAAPKAAAKKTGSAAQFRMKEEADKAKAYNNPSNKDAKDARGRASKYGTPVGPTMSKTTVKGPSLKIVNTDTIVKSSRGNRYVVSENKVKVPGPDRWSTKVSPTAETAKKLAKQGSAAAFRKAETASNKKKKK